MGDFSTVGQIFVSYQCGSANRFDGAMVVHQKIFCYQWDEVGSLAKLSRDFAVKTFVSDAKLSDRNATSCIQNQDRPEGLHTIWARNWPQLNCAVFGGIGSLPNPPMTFSPHCPVLSVLPFPQVGCPEHNLKAGLPAAPPECAVVEQV